MAVELAVYEDDRKIIVHTSTCASYSSVAREYQTSPVVKVPEGWRVIKCERCRPNIHSVLAVKRRVHSISPPPALGQEDKPESMQHPAYKLSYWRRGISRNNPDSSFPPYGVVALDITHSENRDKWWTEAECLGSDDDPVLAAWLEWLYTGEHTEHWTLTVQKVICSQCPVRTECLEQGVWGHETWGVWGGANELERKRLRTKWITEGRVDERPNRPSNNVQRQDGSRVATTSQPDPAGLGQGSRHDETTSADMQEVSSTREVRWPRTDGWTGSRWTGEDDSYRGSAWETGGF